MRDEPVWSRVVNAGVRASSALELSLIVVLRQKLRYQNAHSSCSRLGREVHRAGRQYFRAQEHRPGRCSREGGFSGRCSASKLELLIPTEVRGCAAPGTHVRYRRSFFENVRAMKRCYASGANFVHLQTTLKISPTEINMLCNAVWEALVSLGATPHMVGVLPETPSTLEVRYTASGDAAEQCAAYLQRLRR